MRTRITDLLGIRHPILLAGMAGSTDAALVAAVSRAGGLGILGVSTYPTADLIRAEVAKVREFTPNPFGINLLLWGAPEYVEPVLELQPAVLSTAWGDVAPHVEAAHEAGCLVMHMVQDVPGAEAAAKAGVDLIVAQGQEGGGHVGLLSTFALVPQVVDAVGDVPVVASGGIGDGRGLAAALALGAEAVLIGTRFLATKEAPIDHSWKLAILEAGGQETLRTSIPDIANEAAWPEPAAARTLRNALVERWLGRESELRSQAAEAGAKLQEARRRGDIDEMALYAGEVVGLIKDLPAAGDLVERIVREAEALLPQLTAKVVGRAAPKA